MTRSCSSRVYAICSDIHFDLHDKAAWAAFRAWHAEAHPHRTVILGDFLDFGMLSKYAQHPDDPVFAIPQIQMFVREANALSLESGGVVVLEGNHDERWEKILGVHPHFLRGAKGLSLQDQCRAQGLSQHVVWKKEDLHYRGVPVGPFNLRHGHKQAGKHGGPKHVAANRLQKTMGNSEVVGHHHRAQMMCQTGYGKTAISIANPALADSQRYALDADWQTGFTILETFGDREQYCTPHLIVMSEGAFAWNGRVYDGKYILAERARKAKYRR